MQKKKKVNLISRLKKKILKKSDRPKENKSASAKPASIKHCKFYQVSHATNLTSGTSFSFL